MIVAILIGREGSTGYPGKNVAKLLDLPMVEYPLKVASEAPSIDRIYVSTDSQRIKDIAQRYNATVIDRPAHLCTKEALGEDVYVHAWETIKRETEMKGEKVELLVLLMANAPTVSSALIENGIKTLLAHRDYDSAVTVSCYNMWSPLRARKIDAEGLLVPFVPFETFGDPKTLNCDRDSQGDVWFADMGLSIVRPHNLENIEEGLLPQKWMGQRIYPLRQVAGLDIDYEWQMPQAEFWLKHMSGTGGA
jgi:hypothetical protein